MVTRPSIISESEVFITVLFLLCLPCYTAVQIKNCSKSTVVITVATMKNTMVPRAPLIVWNWSIHCPSLSAVFDSLLSSTSQDEVFEKYLCNKSSHYEKYGLFLVTQRKPSRATTKLTLFTVNKDEWYIKEDTGKSLKNTFARTLVCQKVTLGMKWCRTVKKSSP